MLMAFLRNLNRYSLPCCSISCRSSLYLFLKCKRICPVIICRRNLTVCSLRPGYGISRFFQLIIFLNNFYSKETPVSVTMSPGGPRIKPIFGAALVEHMVPGTRVVRGHDWIWGNQVIFHSH